ncbi:copper resistance CopC family protein [Curtobacterium sp. 1P10AnD]|uniref:Copper resistance protein CopC n=3 Tax=Curtobacterium TaxID=2034 RepID=A0ABT7TRF7_9MICO|nr:MULTISPECIES: copper resistance CopC family protein [Curtobacterium]NUU26950.1 copper resistance protein CopC [Curtobacterium albidum]MDM7884773.1 copper resistance protein CopC [Curtobacterium citri]MDM7892183.1 copper resistance protein CopC [Curtobacterium caseinilyticum]MDT0210099.1 copper resistance protein CopC [Curtobacterium sp. BRD11]WIJ45342.1 copper resistance protein CopC [Curtobacterium citreum]
MRLRALIATAVPVAVLAAVLVTATPAAAHDALASANPAADSTVAGDLDQITLTYSEPPLAALESGIIISVVDPDDEEVTTGQITVDGSTLTKPITITTPGSYTVTWRSVSVDGHPISGSYQFTSTGSTPSPTPSASTPQETPTPTAAASSAATPAASGAESAPSNSAGIWVLAGLTALFIVAIVGILLLTRRRPKAPE